MKILLYNPDNGVTRNFMPHLWMFLLQALTPSGHEVILIDGNARAMTEEELVRFARREGIGLVGIGAMTRMVARAYRFAVALGEADETWPLIVADAARGELKDIYEPERDAKGNDKKPSLQPYPHIPWETLELDQFNLVPGFVRPLLKRMGGGWGKFHVVPMETGRGCPYGCEFCTVTGFFGDSIRFRTNESVVGELLRLKARARRERGQVAVFFIDDNLAINAKRTKSLLRDIIEARAQVPWVAQISANLLRDEELIDVIAESGGKWVFIGMESIDPANMADVNKNFSKPGEYGAVLDRLARRNIYAITSFIFGMDNDTVGVASRTLREIESWPPGLPVFGQLTPFPATPLYSRLEKAGRLARPKHWLDFAPFWMAHAPLKMTISEARQETNQAWVSSYSPRRNADAIDSISDAPLKYRISHLVARLFFRGIYFPQMGKRAWIKLIAANRRTIYKLLREGVGEWRATRRKKSDVPVSI